jgi:hypothetical protein
MCNKCGDIQISNSRKRHDMNFCKCESVGFDLEECYSRISASNPNDFKILKRIEHWEMDIFGELLRGYFEQGNPKCETMNELRKLFSFFEIIEKEILIDLVK